MIYPCRNHWSLLRFFLRRGIITENAAIRYCRENMKKILLVEDEELIINLLSKKLAGLGFDVDLAMDGREGMKRMRENLPDLVLLDIVMPKMGGFEVIKEMKEDPLLAKIPVIIISNSGQPLELDKAKKMGVADWLVKTEFDPKEVVEKINKYINAN